MENIDREIAEKVMNWTPPLPLSEGRYHPIYENEEFDIGFVIGYEHTNTGTRFTLKEFEKYEYWTTIDGEPAKAPWGGLVTKGNFYKWAPSNDISQALYLVKILLKQDLYVEIFLSKNYKPEVEISYGENHPKYPKGSCREPGDERIAFIEADTLEMAICLAVLKVVENG